MNKQIYRILMLCTFTVALVAAGCKKTTVVDENKDGFKLSKNTVEVGTNQTVKVEITGNGTYEAFSGNANIVEAAVEGKNVVISAKENAGETVVKVIDTKNSSYKPQEIKVKVTQTPTPPDDPSSGAVIEDGILIRWECEKIPADGNIVIPASVTAIGERAFFRCELVKSVTFGDNIKSVGAEAFSGCVALGKVVFSKELTTIGEKAFYTCRSLTEVNLTEKVKTIGESAFEFCDALQKIELSTSLEEIGNRTFANCKVVKVSIPAKVRTMGYGIFSACENLTSIEVAGANTSFTSADGVLFSKDKTRLLQYPKGKSGTSYSIPTSVKEIDKEAFYICEQLTSVTIPNGVTSIEFATFNGTSITSIEIPNSVTHIGEHAFSQTKLTSVKLPESVASMDANAFANNDNLEKIELNSKITAIPINAFYACIALKTIVWGNSSKITSIDDGAFYKCEKLETLEIPSKVTSIGKLTFSDCVSVTKIHIPATVTAIGERAFAIMFAVTDIKCDAVQPPKLGASVFERIGEDHEDQSVKLTVPKNTKTAYNKAAQWKDFDITEQE